MLTLNALDVTEMCVLRPLGIFLGSSLDSPRNISQRFRLGLKAGSGPDSAEATENTEWVRTEITGNYDLPIPGFIDVTGKDEKWAIYFIFYTSARL